MLSGTQIFVEDMITLGYRLVVNYNIDGSHNTPLHKRFGVLWFSIFCIDKVS